MAFIFIMFLSFYEVIQQVVYDLLLHSTQQTDHELQRTLDTIIIIASMFRWFLMLMWAVGLEHQFLRSSYGWGPKFESWHGMATSTITNYFIQELQLR